MSPSPSILPGAEPFSADGDAIGVLVQHGYTGNPSSMRPLAEGLAAAGFTVVAPRLPGHGTSIDDMLTTGWSDYAAAVEEAYVDLAARCENVVVAGLSMGGTLTAWLATRHPEIAGIVCINAMVEPGDPALKQMVADMIAAGETVAPAVGSDIADPDVQELAYEGSPLAPLLSLLEAVEGLELARITCPVLILTSPQDHVVEPSSSDYLAEQVSGPVERVSLDRSYHVATLDHDKELIIERTVDFVRKVTA